MTLVKADASIVSADGGTERIRRKINFVSAGSAIWSVTDDSVNNEIDVTLTVAEPTLPELGDGQLFGYSSGAGTYTGVGPASADGQLLISDSTQDTGYNYQALSAMQTITPRQKCEFYDDFFMSTTEDGEVGLLGWSVTVSSGSVAAVTTRDDTNSPGIVQLNRSTTAAGRADIGLGTTEVRLGGGVVTVEMRVRISAASDGTNTYTARFGLGDSATADHVDGVYFQHDNTSANWIIKTANNSTRTSTTTSTAVATGSTWVRLKFIINAAASSITYYVNDVSVGTITTNIPTASDRVSAPRIHIIGSAGTTDRNIQCDYYYFGQIFSSAR